jgi:DNA-binding transcriptional ArsR family regulator
VDGKPPKDIVLDVIRSSDIDLSAGEIKKLTGLSSPTASKWVEVLKAEGKIVETRRIGRSKFYASAPGNSAERRKTDNSRTEGRGR